MPGSGWQISFSALPKWSSDEAREHYSSWLFARLLRDVLECFGNFLDECHDIAGYLGLIRKQQEGVLLGQDYFDHQASSLKYRQLGIDKKIRKLKPWTDALSPDLQESIRSINRARNILTHHEGIVPETYSDQDGKFRIAWIRPTLAALGPQEREVKLGERLMAGEGLGLRAVSETREFGKGDHLRLEPIDFSGICWSLFTAGDTIRGALEKAWFHS